MIFIAIVAFIIIFSVLVLVHEWGHFVMARRAGIKVEEFGIGLPPRAKKLFKDKKGTIYSLNWIPFGGYVKLFGEDITDPKILNDKKSFASKTILQRSLVVVSGVFMNFLLAWVLITIGFVVGMKPFIISQHDMDEAIKKGLVETTAVLYVHEIDPSSPLSVTDLKVGDVVAEIDGKRIPENGDLSGLITPDKEIILTIVRDKKEGSLNVKSDSNGKLGFRISVEQFVIDTKNVTYPFYRAPVEAVKEVARLSVATVNMLGDVIVSLVQKLAVPEGVAGPFGIARMTYHFTQQGIMALVQFTAILSISLGVINIMPFPALDGGRFLFILFELIVRKKPNAKWESAIHGVGFSLLLMLIVLVTWNDILAMFK